MPIIVLRIQSFKNVYEIQRIDRLIASYIINAKAKIINATRTKFLIALSFIYLHTNAIIVNDS